MAPRPPRPPAGPGRRGGAGGGGRSSPGRACGSPQRKFLDAPVQGFADVEFGGGAAVHRVHGAELLEEFAGFAKAAQDFAVELHLVDLAVVEIAGVVGIGAEEIRVSTGRDADSPRRADARDLGLERAFAIEDLDALIAAVGDVDVVLRVGGDGQWEVELPGICATGAPALEVLAVRVHLGDACVAVAVGDVNVAGRIEGDVGGLVEVVAGDAGTGAATPSAAAALADGFGLAAERHDDAALGIELD